MNIPGTRILSVYYRRMSGLLEIPFIGLKLTSTALVFLLTLICSFAPWIISLRFKKSNKLIPYLNSLAGGVVLGALLMHMIPEIVGHGHAHGHGHGKKKKERKKEKNPDHLHSFIHDGHDHAHSFQIGPFAAGISFLLLFAIDRLFLTHSHCQDAQKEMTQVDDSSSPHLLHQDGKRKGDVEECCRHDHAVDEDVVDEHGSCHSADLVGGCHMDGINSAASQTQTFIFVLALSIHSFLEGLGMATKNKKSDLVLYLISLYAHKWLEAFALGVSIIKARFSRLHTILLVLFYAALTPAGILLGLGLDVWVSGGSGDGKFSWLTRETTSLVLNGLAVGSFLFVSCIEMIPPEFHKKTKHTPFKYLALVAGFGSMAAISALH